MRSVIRSIISCQSLAHEQWQHPQTLSSPALPSLGELLAERDIIIHKLYITLIKQNSPLAHLFSACLGAPRTAQVTHDLLTEVLSSSNPSNTYPPSSTPFFPTASVEPSFSPGTAVHSVNAHTPATNTAPAHTHVTTSPAPKATVLSHKVTHECAHTTAPAQSITAPCVVPTLPPLVLSLRPGGGGEGTSDPSEEGWPSDVKYACGSTLDETETPLPSSCCLAGFPASSYCFSYHYPPSCCLTGTSHDSPPATQEPVFPKLVAIQAPFAAFSSAKPLKHEQGEIEHNSAHDASVDCSPLHAVAHELTYNEHVSTVGPTEASSHAAEVSSHVVEASPHAAEMQSGLDLGAELEASSHATEVSSHAAEASPHVAEMQSGLDLVAGLEASSHAAEASSHAAETSPLAAEVQSGSSLGDGHEASSHAAEELPHAATDVPRSPFFAQQAAMPVAERFYAGETIMTIGTGLIGQFINIQWIDGTCYANVTIHGDIVMVLASDVRHLKPVCFREGKKPLASKMEEHLPHGQVVMTKKQKHAGVVPAQDKKALTGSNSSSVPGSVPGSASSPSLRSTQPKSPDQAVAAVTRGSTGSLPTQVSPPPRAVDASQLHHPSLSIQQSDGRGLGVFGPPLPKHTVLGPYTGQMVSKAKYDRLGHSKQSYGAQLTSDGSFYLVGRPGFDFICRLNEPREGELANCYFLNFSVSDARSSGDAYDELEMLWVITASELTDSAELVEYTISYGKGYAAVRLDPNGIPYVAGGPPPGLGPPTADALALVNDFCVRCGYTLRDVSCSYGMPIAENNEALCREAQATNATAIDISKSIAALDSVTEEPQGAALPDGNDGDRGDHDVLAVVEALGPSLTAELLESVDPPQPLSKGQQKKAWRKAKKAAQKAQAQDTAPIVGKSSQGPQIEESVGSLEDGVSSLNLEQSVSPSPPPSKPAKPRMPTSTEVAVATVKRAGLRFGGSVRWTACQAQLALDSEAVGFLVGGDSLNVVGRLRDADVLAGIVVCTIESESGWMLATPDSPQAYSKYHVIYIPIEHVATVEVELPKPRMPKYGFSVCVGSTGTACNSLAASLLGVDHEELTGTPLQSWLDGAVWWATELCRSLPVASDAPLVNACDELRRAIANFTISPRRSVEYVTDTVGLLLDMIAKGIKFMEGLPVTSAEAGEVISFNNLVHDLFSYTRDELILLFQSSGDKIVLGFARSWCSARKAIISRDADLTGGVIAWSAKFAMLPLAVSLSKLLEAVDALDELLPDEPSSQSGTTHFHAPSPDCGRSVYSALQLSVVRWFQHAYRESRRALRRMLTDGTHPLVRGPPSWHALADTGKHAVPPLPPHRATGTLVETRASDEVRAARWRAYFTAPIRKLDRQYQPETQWRAAPIRTFDENEVVLLQEACAISSDPSFTTSIAEEGHAGWSFPLSSRRVDTLRHVLPPWREYKRKMQCGYGKHLASEELFKAVRNERNRVLHVGAFLAALYKACTGHTPRIVVGGGSAGGANHGMQRMGIEHCNIDIAHQPQFVKTFGNERFRLGDATDPTIYEPELCVPGTLGMFMTLDCQLYTTINKAAMRSGKGDVSHTRLVPDAGHIAQDLFKRGYEVTCENSRGASRVMQEAFPYSINIFGHHCGTRTGRPRICGATSPIATLACTPLMKRLYTGMCNGTWRRMPVLDNFGRPVREPCCRGNTVPMHGTTQPRLPIGLLNQVMGLSPHDMRWPELAQALPPAYGSIMSMHMVYAQLQRHYQLPIINFDRINSTDGCITSGLPMHALLHWAHERGISKKFTELTTEYFYSNEPIKDYVAGDTHMNFTPQLDTLQPGDHMREALGPRASQLCALERQCACDCSAGCCTTAHLSTCTPESPALHVSCSASAMAGSVIVRACQRVLQRRHGRRAPRQSPFFSHFAHFAAQEYMNAHGLGPALPPDVASLRPGGVGEVAETADKHLFGTETSHAGDATCDAPPSCTAADAGDLTCTEHASTKPLAALTRQRGLLGGAFGDGDAARLDGVRLRKLTADPNGPGLIIRTGTCRGRSVVPREHNYDMNWDDRPLRTIRTDLLPELQVDVDSEFPSPLLGEEQWQLLGHYSIPEISGNEGICPRCKMVSSNPTCPACGRSPEGMQTRGKRSASTAEGAGTATNSLVRGGHVTMYVHDDVTSRDDASCDATDNETSEPAMAWLNSWRSFQPAASLAALSLECSSSTAEGDAFHLSAACSDDNAVDATPSSSNDITNGGDASYDATSDGSVSEAPDEPPDADPAIRTYAPKLLRNYNLSEKKKQKLALLIEKHTQQLSAPTTPIGSGRDSCKDMSHEHATSCHFEELAVLSPEGKLRAVPDCILDIGAFRGIASRSKLQHLINISAPGAVRYAEYSTPEKLSAQTVGGDSPECVGQALIDFYISGRLFTINLLIISHGNILLLGNDFSNCRCCGIDFERKLATLKHCPDGKACTRFETPISTITEEGARKTVAAWAAVAKEAEAAPVNGARTYFLYTSTPKRIDKWSRSAVRMKLPDVISKGANLLVERLGGDAPSRSIARVEEGFYKAQDGYIETGIINPSLSSSTYVSEMEPIAKVTVEPEHFAAENYADMTLEELMDTITFGDGLSEEEKNKFRPIIAAHLFAFSMKRIGKLHGTECRIPTPLIDEGKATPPFVPPRKMSPDQYAQAWAEFKKLEDQGLLTPTGGGGYGTPIVMVKKPKPDSEGKPQYRMCADFRLLNNLSTKDAYPLPNPIEALNALGNANWFTALDQGSAFHQVPIAEKDKIKTTISFPWGQYYYETMPFGLVGATSVFQRAIDSILSGIAWHPGATHRHFALGYIDDITVYTEGSLEDHLRDVNTVLGRLAGSGAVLKPTKCCFAMREIEFLGHIVCGEGTKMQLTKVDALCDLLPPNAPVTPADLKKLVQAGQYYARFIDGWAHLAHAIHTALADHARSGRSLESLKVRASIKAIKHAFNSDQVLARPDFTKPFRLAVDTAVSSGVGAVLTQRDKGGFHRPIAFYSRAFAHGGEERRWSVTQAECSGVVEATEHFRYYILPNPHTTELITDHASLQYLLTAKQLSDVLTRYAMRLSEFDVTLVHEAGKLLIVPDAISRLVKPAGPAPKPPSRGKPRSTIWETLRAPRDVEEACLVLLDAAGENALVQSDDDTLALPHALVKPKEQLTATTSRIYEGLRHSTGIRLDPRAPLEQIYIGKTVYIFKRILPDEWHLPSGSLTRLENFETLLSLKVNFQLSALLHAWHCARANGERPLPHPPAYREQALTAVAPGALAAVTTTRKPLPTTREVALVVIMGDQVLLSKHERARVTQDASSKQLDSYYLPRERYCLPLSDPDESEEARTARDGGSALHHALSFLWQRVMGEESSRDLVDPDGNHMTWSWGSHGTQYVIVHLPPRPVPPTSSCALLPLDYFCTACTWSKELDKEVGGPWIPRDKNFDKDLLRRLCSMPTLTPPNTRCALLNCRTSAGGLPKTFDDEEPQVTEAADGTHPQIQLVRTAEAACKALREIDHYFQHATGHDRVLALDIEGALRVHGWIGLLQVCFGEWAYVFDTIYAPAIAALVSPPSSWSASSLAKHLGDHTIAKVVHSGGGDAMALYANYGIALRNVFDTYHADMLLRGARCGRGLGTVLEEWIDMPRPDKADFQHTDTLWRERPLTWRALSYAAEDVLHCVQLYHVMRKEAARFGITNCLSYMSLRLPSSCYTPVLILPWQGKELLVRETTDDPNSHHPRFELLTGYIHDSNLRQPLPLEVRNCSLDLWLTTFGLLPSYKHDTVRCQHIGKSLRLGPLQVTQPAVHFVDRSKLPDGLRIINCDSNDPNALRDSFGLRDLAAIEYCLYLEARDMDLLPALPPSISPLTARGAAALISDHCPHEEPGMVASTSDHGNPVQAESARPRKPVDMTDSPSPSTPTSSRPRTPSCDNGSPQLDDQSAGASLEEPGHNEELNLGSSSTSPIESPPLTSSSSTPSSGVSAHSSSAQGHVPTFWSVSQRNAAETEERGWGDDRFYRAPLAPASPQSFAQQDMPVRQLSFSPEQVASSTLTAPSNSQQGHGVVDKAQPPLVADGERDRPSVGTALAPQPAQVPVARQGEEGVRSAENPYTGAMTDTSREDSHGSKGVCVAHGEDVPLEVPSGFLKVESHPAARAHATCTEHSESVDSPVCDSVTTIDSPCEAPGAPRLNALPSGDLAALQPRADAASFAAMIVRDNSHALVMNSYALDRQPGQARATVAGWVFPKGRLHSGFKGSIVARQALENVLGPFERVSAGAYDGIGSLNYLGRVSDTMYYEAHVHNLRENAIALFAAWQQRAATPSDAASWIGFDLVKLDELVDRLDRSDDTAAAGLVSSPLASVGQCLLHVGHVDESKAHDHPAKLHSLDAQPLDTAEALRYLVAMDAYKGAFDEPLDPSVSQQGRLGAASDIAAVKEPLTLEQLSQSADPAELHKLADKLKSYIEKHGSISNDEPVNLSQAEESTSTTQAEESTATTECERLLQAAANAAAKSMKGAKGQLKPSIEATPDDPTLGNDDTSNVARTRVPGWAPEVTRAVLQEEQNADDYIRVLIELARPTGFVKRGEHEGTFELVNGLLYRVEKYGPAALGIRRVIVVPATLRGAFLRAYHDRTGHLGVKRVLSILRERAWWIGARRDVRAYIMRCPTCAFTKLTRIQAGQARSLGNGDHPGDVWTYDILDIDSILRKQHKNKLEASGEPYDSEALDNLYHPHKLLIFVDRFSRWAEAFPLEKDPTADEVLDIFVNEIVRRHGYPRAMTSDRGSNLIQGSVAEYYEACGIQLVANDSYMHNTAGLVERFNGTLKDLLRGFLQDVDEDADVIGSRWWRYLTYALLAYNTSDATSTGYSPFFLMYGRDARTPLQNTLLPPPSGDEVRYSSFVEEHLKHLYAAWEDSRLQLEAAAATSRQQQNLSRDITFELKPGDRVLIKKPNHQGLEVPYSGPFRVANVLGDDRVQLRDLHRVMHDEFHISRLKLYPYVDNDGNVVADREEYVLKDVLNHRKNGDGEGYEYYVTWDGWRASDGTWTHESEFNIHGLELISAYWERLKADDKSTSAARDTGITKSTAEEAPITKAPAFRSHREQHLQSAPSEFKADEQVAPEAATSRVKTAQAKHKKNKLNKQKKKAKQTSATPAAAAPPSSASESTSTTTTTSSSTKLATKKSDIPLAPSSKNEKVKVTAASHKPSRSVAKPNYTS